MMNKKACAISHKEYKQETNMNDLKMRLKGQIDDTNNFELLQAIYTVIKNYGKKTWKGAK